jgi:formate dehydrogenase beta subunit
VGSHKAHAMVSDILAEGGGADDVPDTIDQLEETVRLTSICGLGQVALGPVLSVLQMERQK